MIAVGENGGPAGRRGKVGYIDCDIGCHLGVMYRSREVSPLTDSSPLLSPSGDSFYTKGDVSPTAWLFVPGFDYC